MRTQFQIYCLDLPREPGRMSAPVELPFEVVDSLRPTGLAKLRVLSRN